MLKRGQVAELVLLNERSEKFSERILAECISYVHRELQEGGLEAFVDGLIIDFTETEMDRIRTRDEARMELDRQERSQFEETLNRRDGWPREET